MPRTAARALVPLALGCMVACTHRSVRPPPPPVPAEVLRLVATAYCQRGVTASGARVRTGMVAADPRVLPLGTVLTILEPPSVGGTYTVADTGSAIKGRKLDIYMPDCRRAVTFGRQRIVVRVVRRAAGE